MEKRSWGIELWDQPDALIRHENEQAVLDDQYIRFLSELQRTVLDFSKKYKKTIANYSFKKKSTGELSYNTCLADSLVSLQETGDLFEQYAVDFQKSIVDVMKQEYEKEKKISDKTTAEYTKLCSKHDRQRKKMDESWRSYVLALKEKKKAEQLNALAQADRNIPRDDQIKAEVALGSKTQAFKVTEQTYAADVESFKASQNHFYAHHMYQIVSELENLDFRRSSRTKDLLGTFVNLGKTLTTKLDESGENLRSIVCKLDPEKDLATIIQSKKSDNLYPVDVPFINLELFPQTILENPTALMNQVLGLTNGNAIKATNTSGGFSIKFGKSKTQTTDSLRTAFIGGIGINPVKIENMTICQINDRVRVLKDQRDKVIADKKATSRLQETYVNNPKLGNSEEAQRCIDKLERQIFSLSDMISKLETQFETLGGDQALVQTQSQINRINPLKSPESNVSVPQRPPRHSVRKSASFSDFDSDASDVDQNSQSNKVASNYVGIATAKYDYEGSGSEYLSARVGETFFVVELDSDSTGWTPVVSENGSRHGFVPTAYMDIHTY